MRFNTEAHGEALHARAPQVVEVVRVVEDQVQCFSELAARVGEHCDLALLARHVALREALVVVVDVLRLRPGAHDGRVVDGRDDDFVDVLLRERLCGRPVSIEQSRRWRECTAVASMA